MRGDSSLIRETLLPRSSFVILLGFGIDTSMFNKNILSYIQRLSK